MATVPNLPEWARRIDEYPEIHVFRVNLSIPDVAMNMAISNKSPFWIKILFGLIKRYGKVQYNDMIARDCLEQFLLRAREFDPYFFILKWPDGKETKVW